MADLSATLSKAPDTERMLDHLRRARKWAWDLHGARKPGAARDLAWTITQLVADHDPETYSPWLNVRALEADNLRLAIDLVNSIVRAIRMADALQPHLIRKTEANQ